MSLKGSFCLAIFNSDSTPLSTWYNQPLGQNIALMERDQLIRHLPKLHGSYLLQIGGDKQLDWIDAHSFMHRIGTYQSIKPREDKTLLQCLYLQLPFGDNNIDAVILAHILEFEAASQEILHEAWRILSPEGHLIILGFNPWSFWGLRKLCTLQHAASIPWQGQFHSMHKIRHWLTQLDAEIIVSKNFCFRPPLNNSRLFNKFQWFEPIGRLLVPWMGSIYLLVAQKHTLPLTAIKPRWHWQNIFASNKNLAEPTAGSVRRG